MSYLPPGEKWTAFYEESEPDARRRILAETAAPDDGCDRLRAEIFERRHPQNPKAHELKDVYLWQCVQLMYLYRTKSRIFVRTKKKTAEAARELGLIGAEGPERKKALTKEEESLYYWEFRNTARRYFSTCSGPHYRKRFFGLAPLSDEERVEEIVKDAFQMGEGIAMAAGMEDVLRIWSDAVRDEYCARDILAADRYAAFRKKELEE